MKQKQLGVLKLGEVDRSPPPPPNSFSYPDWFGFPVIELEVPGTPAREVVGGNMELAKVFAIAAHKLEQRGASVITVDCGYSVIYQQAISQAVSVPVVTSSLLQLPRIGQLVPAGGRIGLVVFDKPRLTPLHLACAGFTEGGVPLGVVGIEGSNTWKNWLAEEVTTDYNDLVDVTINASRQLITQYPDVTHILLECTGCPRCAEQIQSETGLPVFDWVSLVKSAMDSVY